MEIYRVIEQQEADGVFTYKEYENMRDAYRACVPADESMACRLLLNGVQTKLLNGEDMIRVTCNRGTIYWIQRIVNSNTPLPLMNGLKIECCHGH